MGRGLMWIVALYNWYMGGVDLSDQLRGSYHVRLKCMKNYKYVFCFLLDVSVTNALILHSFDVQTGSAMEQKQFRLILADRKLPLQEAGWSSKEAPTSKHRHPHRPLPHPLNKEPLRIL